MRSPNNCTIVASHTSQCQDSTYLIGCWVLYSVIYACLHHASSCSPMCLSHSLHLPFSFIFCSICRIVMARQVLRMLASLRLNQILQIYPKGGLILVKTFSPHLMVYVTFTFISEIEICMNPQASTGGKRESTRNLQVQQKEEV